MNKKSISKLGSGVAVAAIASLAMLSTGHADQLASDKAELGITAINSTIEHSSGGKAADFDYSQYNQVNLGPLSATIWAPKRGAQGPMRDEEASQQQMMWRDIQSRLGPVGGTNTP
jgi:hypothetical protein